MLPRHSIVRLTAAGWRDAEDSACAGSRAALAAWRSEGFPLIARRQEPDADESQCCLGLAMPPDPATGVKRRIALRAARVNLQDVMPPLPLVDVIPAAPPAWCAALRKLDQRAGEHGIVLRVYGSLALQRLTGKRYLSPSSDIDLLLSPSTRAQLDAGLALLAEFGADMPLDGEIVFGSGHAVAWREWLAAAQGRSGARVLTKSVGGVALCKPEDLLTTLDAAPCTP